MAARVAGILDTFLRNKKAGGFRLPAFFISGLNAQMTVLERLRF